MLDLLKIDPSYTKRRRSTPKEGEIFELVPHTTSIITIPRYIISIKGFTLRVGWILVL